MSLTLLVPEGLFLRTVSILSPVGTIHVNSFIPLFCHKYLLFL
jgi:hypothetical protein